MSSPQPSRTTQFVERVLGTPTAALLALILFALVNFLAARHYRRFDWTRNQLFTLSSRSKEIIHAIRTPLDMYILLGRQEQQYNDVTELADRYAAENGLLHVHVIDPDRQRDRFLQLVQRLGLRLRRSSTSDVSSDAAIVVVRGERHWEVPPEDLAGLSADPSDEDATNARGGTVQVTVERAISGAILHVERDETTKVCFSTGHDEMPLEGGDDSVSLIATELRHENITTQPVALNGNATVPSACDALVVAGPHQAFATGEADAITRYLHAGGNVLLMVDPMFSDTHYVATGLESVAALGGIELTQSVIIEPDPAHQMPEMLPVVFFATDMGEHAITHELRGADARVLVSTARGLRRLAASTVVPDSLLRTTTGAWGETSTTDAIQNGQLQKNPGDIDGPLSIAMAATVPDVHASARRTDASGRLVVIGYSYLANNEMLTAAQQARFANGFFVVACLGWLTSHHELVDIPAHPASAAALSISLQDVRHIRIYTVLLIPLAALLIGFAVWRSRKVA